MIIGDLKVYINQDRDKTVDTEAVTSLKKFLGTCHSNQVSSLDHIHQQKLYHSSPQE